MTRSAVAAATAVAAVASIAAAQDAASVLRYAEATYRATTTFRAEFTQTLENPMLGGPEESRGVLFLAPPNKFAMRFTEPEGDRIVADGTHLWIYAPTSVPEQVIRRPIPTSGAQTPNLVAQFVERPLERYEATLTAVDTVAAEVVDVVGLVPHDRELPFRRAEIAVARASGLLRRIMLVERSGQRRTLVFDDVLTNIAIPPRELRFEPPRGVRVVEP